MAQIKYKDYEIEVWVELYEPDFPYDPDYADVFDTVSEARHYQKVWPGTKDKQIRWCAAEIINKDGDVNPAVAGATKSEALNKLKRILYPPKKREKQLN
jgi:hypothetical protein